MDHNRPAWAAGLRPNQLITHINGKNVTGLQHVEVVSLMAASLMADKNNHSITISAILLEDTGIREVKDRHAPAKGHRIGRPSHHGSERRPSHLAHFLRSDTVPPTKESPNSRQSSPYLSRSFNESGYKKLDRHRKSSFLSSLTTNKTFSGHATHRNPSRYGHGQLGPKWGMK